MGLDVYLKKCVDLKAAVAAEAAFETETAGVWEDGVDKKVRDDRLAAAQQRHGTCKWGEHASREDAAVPPSTIDPDHYFKIGYFRSSYNESGINNVMRKLGLPDLSAIMGAPQDGNDFAPDWEASLSRVTGAINGYEKHLSSEAGKFRVTEIRPMFDMGVQNEQEALAEFMKQAEGHKGGSDFNSFSSGTGTFFLNGMNVRAFITKKYAPPRADDLIGRIINTPAIFVVYDAENSDKEDWHLTALRIVKETCEWVIAQPDRQQYYMHWSG